MKQPTPKDHLEQLKELLYPFLLLGPLISALLADKIDNQGVACVLFVLFVGMVFVRIKKRIDSLAQAIEEQESEVEKLRRRVRAGHL